MHFVGIKLLPIKAAEEIKGGKTQDFLLMQERKYLHLLMECYDKGTGIFNLLFSTFCWLKYCKW